MNDEEPVPDRLRPDDAAHTPASASDPEAIDFGRPPTESAVDDRTPPARPVVACLLAWLIPGLGHAWLGDRARAAIFALVLLGMFFGGIALEGLVYRPGDGDVLTLLASVGGAGIGGPYAIAWLQGWGAGNFEAPYFEYGNTFTLVAGLLNLLVVLDAFDLARGRSS